LPGEAASAPVARLEKPVQLGIVVKDLEATTRALNALFGIGPFRFIEWPNRPDSHYWFRGREETIRIRQAFAQVGPIEIELIQPLEGERNAYRQFLDEKGGGVHHILFEVDDMDTVTGALSGKGIEILQMGTGIRPGTRWALLDSEHALGFLLELRQRAPGCDGTSIPEGPA
jgi:methylmalonyl-CoA/ethylmalonyl-CoA epimerase